MSSRFSGLVWFIAISNGWVKVLLRRILPTKLPNLSKATILWFGQSETYRLSLISIDIPLGVTEVITSDTNSS